MDKEQLKYVLESHGKWLRHEGGERANLYGADLLGANLRGANLRWADLRGANLREANLRGANLHEANLHEADLYEANLYGANLRGADLREANLLGANLRWADLRGADLREANLLGADLREANLRWANLIEKIIQVGPIGSRKDYTIYWIDRDVVQCGCWNNYNGGSLDEFKRRIDEEYPKEKEETLKYRNEYLAAIAMFERLRDDARQPL